MNEGILTSLLKRKHCTLLGVGPMSINCVNAAIELSNDYAVPLMLIASRRQIDSEEFGSGYVNNWSTQDFANYVTKMDLKSQIILARDHGGPWQHPKEVNENLSLSAAMKSAKLSYLRDIEAGFQILHIDPSVDIHSSPNIDEILNRIFELYEYCWTQANRLGKDILFEVGTEEQTGKTNTQDELDYTLNKILNFCIKNKIPKPTFVVVQTGTRVMETRNIGSFDTPLRVRNELPAEIQVPKMIEICSHHGVMMKEHNTDYLSDEALRWHPRLGIHAANVAPEFGVAETYALLEILEENNLHKFVDEFLALSYASKKWEKWMLKDTAATDRDRSIISGHYIFSNPNFINLKSQIQSELANKKIDLDLYLKSCVKKAIYRYMKNFRLIGA